MAHTPGQWKCDRMRRGDDRYVVVTSIPPHPVVARASILEDVVLIANAPDMLAELDLL